MSLYLCPRWRNKIDLFIYLFIICVCNCRMREWVEPCFPRPSWRHCQRYGALLASSLHSNRGSQGCDYLLQGPLRVRVPQQQQRKRSPPSRSSAIEGLTETAAVVPALSRGHTRSFLHKHFLPKLFFFIINSKFLLTILCLCSIFT